MEKESRVEALWSPSPEQLASATLTRFQVFVESRFDQKFLDYDGLWQWSVTELEDFWAAIWEFFEVGDSNDYDEVLTSDGMPGADWFSGAELNLAAFLLAQGDGVNEAIVTVDERGNSTVLTRAELRDQTARLASTLRAAGVNPGDRVVGYVPNIGKAVVAFLATAWIGAVWSSVGQDYAAPAAIDRFAQLEPVVLIAADGYVFNGKIHDRIDAVRDIQSAIPSVTTTILIDRIGSTEPRGECMTWAEAVSGEDRVDPVSVPFSSPLWVLFSSGTTGIPKGLVHGHGGILIETLKQMGLHWNLRGDDRVFWYTSPSWVMWNLQLSTLVIGGSIVCYDGSPTYPDASTLWRLVSDLGVTFFGSSPGYLQATADAGVAPAQQFDLTRLRAMGSTGSPLSPHMHEWATAEVGAVPLYSMSGGTDIAGAFCGGSPTVPIWPGELSVRCLGVAMEAWDESGQAQVDSVGEMVIHRPMPSMPLRLWNDPDNSRYIDSYMSVYPGVWRQGDWITVTSRGSIVIHGRSDSTLNRNGVRMGSADIYAALDGFTEISESLVIGAELVGGGYWMPLFVVLNDGTELDPALISRINAAIREWASPRHVPDDVVQVVGIPHTRTGKKLEVPIKRILQGSRMEDVSNLDAIDEPAFLRAFAEIAAARSA